MGRCRSTRRDIRTSIRFPLFATWLPLALACAKGSEISPSDVVILEALPGAEADASVDAGALPAEGSGGAALAGETPPASPEQDVDAEDVDVTAAGEPPAGAADAGAPASPPPLDAGA